MFSYIGSRTTSEKDPVSEYTDLYMRWYKAEGILYIDPFS